MSTLFEPGKIGKMELKNRFVHSATYEVMAKENGEVTDELVKRYRFISMSRPFIREPLIVKKFKEGKADRVSCVSCNKCLAV